MKKSHISCSIICNQCTITLLCLVLIASCVVYSPGIKELRHIFVQIIGIG